MKKADNMKGFSPLVMIIGVAVILLGIGFILFSYVLPAKKMAAGINTPTQESAKQSDFPKLAYIETTGIADSSNKNPDLGGVFTINPDGTDKKLLYKFDRDLLAKSYGFPIYSPNTHEILEDTSKGITAIDVNTGHTRSVFEIEQNSSVSYVLSSDKNSIYITTNDINSTGFTSNTKYFNISLTDNGAKPQEIKSIPPQGQPLFDGRLGKRVEIKVKDATTGGAGTQINSSQIIVTETKTNIQKTFLYNKPGEIDPLFIANGFVYFKVSQCCASTSSISTLTQMDLENGKFSEPTSLPSIAQKLADKSVTVSDRGISPDGTYYAYATSTGSEQSKTYIYNTQTNQESEIAVPGEAFTNWSSDGSTVLLNYDQNGGFIYNTQTKQLTQLKSPPSTNYLILK